MKLLYLTDTHFHSGQPPLRVDDVYNTQFEELAEISNLVAEHDVDAIIHGGDLLHDHPKPSHRLIRDLISWASFTNVPIYVVPGNHDLAAYNVNSLSHVGLGVLFESGLFTQLTEKVFEDDRIVIRGVLPEVEPHNDKYVFGDEWQGWSKLIVSHNYISPTPLRFPYLPTKEVKTNADLFLLGHLHEPSDVTIPTLAVGGTRFINPGALSRWGVDEANRVPTIVLMDIRGHKVNIEYVALSCSKPASEIFDLNAVEKAGKKNEQLASFMESLNNTSFEQSDIEQVILSAGRAQNIGEKILNKSLEKIRQAKEVLK